MILANRESFAVHSRGTPTARDYVQNGLVAMWDGIENAGWGQHSDSPIMRELVSGDTLTATGVFSVSENGLTTSGSSSFDLIITMLFSETDAAAFFRSSSHLTGTMNT